MCSEFMETWREMERLVDLGLVRHIWHFEHDTIPKLKLLLGDAPDTPAVERDGALTTLSAARRQLWQVWPNV